MLKDQAIRGGAGFIRDLSAGKHPGDFFSPFRLREIFDDGDDIASLFGFSDPQMVSAESSDLR